MAESEVRRIPVREGLWDEPSAPGEEPRLIADRCLRCGELFFPKKGNGLCTACQSTELEGIPLSPRGRIYSYTVVMRRPPDYYRGEVPYAIGFVELPEGIRVETLLTGCPLDDLKLGMEVELVIERLHEDEHGNEIVTYKFRPI